jgi:hypothetical protein
MNDSNGIQVEPSDPKAVEVELCKWCGRAPRLPRNDYCSPDCFHDAHTPEVLEQTSRYDRDSLLSALRALNAALEELNRATHGDRFDGEDAHKALREIAAVIKQDASLIAARIKALSEEIESLGHRS